MSFILLQEATENNLSYFKNNHAITFISDYWIKKQIFKVVSMTEGASENKIDSPTPLLFLDMITNKRTKIT
jgi:hypothetical protein